MSNPDFLHGTDILAIGGGIFQHFRSYFHKQPEADISEFPVQIVTSTIDSATSIA